MRKHLFYLSLALVAIAFSACSSGKKGVVVDPAMWERPAGRALYDVLDTDVPGLPQSERSFRMMYTSPANYDATLKLIRNIIIADVQDIYTQPKFKYAKDVYASPQTILTIQAPDEASFQTFVTENKQTIIDFFTRAEMNRQIAQLEMIMCLRRLRVCLIVMYGCRQSFLLPSKERISSGQVRMQLLLIRTLSFTLSLIETRILLLRNILCRCVTLL